MRASVQGTLAFLFTCIISTDHPHSRTDGNEEGTHPPHSQHYEPTTLGNVGIRGTFTFYICPLYLLTTPQFGMTRRAHPCRTKRKTEGFSLSRSPPSPLLHETQDGGVQLSCHVAILLACANHKTALLFSVTTPSLARNASRKTLLATSLPHDHSHSRTATEERVYKVYSHFYDFCYIY